MADVQKIRVKEMPRASLLEDGTYVEMEFKGESGERIALSFDPDRLLAFTSRVNQVIHEAQTRRAASAGHLELRPLAVAAVLAAPAAGGSSVIVGFRTDSDQRYAFAVPLDKADELKTELETAVASATEQAKQTRQ